MHYIYTKQNIPMRLKRSHIRTHVCTYVYPHYQSEQPHYLNPHFQACACGLESTDTFCLANICIITMFCSHFWYFRTSYNLQFQFTNHRQRSRTLTEPKNYTLLLLQNNKPFGDDRAPMLEAISCLASILRHALISIISATMRYIYLLLLRFFCTFRKL